MKSRITTFAAVVILLMLSLTVTALAAGEDVSAYAQADMEAINEIIDKNGLEYEKDAPSTWDFVTFWTTEGGKQKVQNIDLNKKNLHGTLDVSKLSKLRYLKCEGNDLTGLNVSGLANISTIQCANNQLSSLDLTGLSTLTTLQCNGNALTTLDLSGLSKLEDFRCHRNNDLAELKGLADCTSLGILTCSECKLETLDITTLTNLTELNCSDNGLTGLVGLTDKTNLKEVRATSNQFEQLDVSGCRQMTKLWCSYNQQLKEITGLKDCEALKDFDCRKSSLSAVDLSGVPALCTVKCDNTPLTEVTLKTGKLKIESGANGTAYISGIQLENNQVSFTTTPKTGYTFDGWYEGDKKWDVDLDTVTKDTTLEAHWTANQYVITYNLDGGTAEGNPDSYTIETDDIILNYPTKSGYTFTGWSGTGLTGEDNMTVTIPKGSTGNREYTAHWRYRSSSSPSYAITVSDKTAHGSVAVSPTNAKRGSTVTITVQPDSGYALETLTATDSKGNELQLTDKGDGKYTFTMPSSKVEVKATFQEDNSVLNAFYDVPNDAYYFEAVKWAVANGITNGISEDLFGPNQSCTRAQIVTFLWRAAGSPVVNYAMDMTDVPADVYYTEAVRWALREGITKGTGERMFSPNATCTRAQAVTFLARALNAKAEGAANFADVPAGSYYADAVAWAAANGVTNGMSDSLFGPDQSCTRAQIVTFLYRAYTGQ